MQAARLLSPPAFRIAAPDGDARLRERFERALEDAVRRALAPAGAAPIVEQVCWHFGIGAARPVRHGKRLRPKLLFMVARAEGGTDDDALDAALAVELLHNYSLVHDDIEDGDDLRHGRQTVWSRFGIEHGINAGDSMCAVSYLTLLRNSTNVGYERIARMARVLHAANLAMCAGQAYDIEFESAPAVSLAAYLAMIDGKTAALFGAACELGALSAGVDEARAGSYGELGRAYGRAFQIRDDALGIWGSREETGKPCATDIARRKWSFPIVWALGRPSSPAREAIAARYAGAEPLEPGDVTTIVTALETLGARTAAEAAWSDAARAAERVAAAHRLDRAGEIEALFLSAPR